MSLKNNNYLMNYKLYISLFIPIIKYQLALLGLNITVLIIYLF
jgi:hypothetical protein